MRDYNLLNAIVHFTSIVVFFILLVCEFETTLLTVVQALTILLCLVVMRATQYDFEKMYNHLNK